LAFDFINFKFPSLHELVDKRSTDRSDDNWHPGEACSGKRGGILINGPVDASDTAKVQSEVICSANNPFVVIGGYQDVDWRAISAG
jgi:hypothetical protein